MQLTEDEPGIEGVTRPRANIYDVQTLGHEVAD